MLEWLSEIKVSDPALFDKIVWFLIGFIVAWFLCMLLMLFDVFYEQKNQKHENAVDLIGEDVVYLKGNKILLGGVVVGVELDEDRKATVLVDCPEIDTSEYLYIKYSEYGKTLFLAKDKPLKKFTEGEKGER